MSSKRTIYLFGGLIAAKLILQAISIEALMQLIRNGEVTISFNVLAAGFVVSLCLGMLIEAKQKFRLHAPPSNQRHPVVNQLAQESNRVDLHAFDGAT